jgi:hypothetical protein
MPIRSAQTTLDQLYAVREDLLLGKLQSYSIGDRNITLFNIQELEQIIRNYEAVVVASESGPVLADMSGPANATNLASPYPWRQYP